MKTKLKAVTLAAAPDERLDLNDATKFPGFWDMFVAIFPKWKRAIVGVVISIISGLLLGAVAGSITEAVMVSAYLWSGSLFLAWMVYFLGLTIALYASLKIGKFIGRVVHDETEQELYDAAKTKIGAKINSVKSWLATKKLEAAK